MLNTKQKEKIRIEHIRQKIKVPNYVKSSATQHTMQQIKTSCIKKFNSG